MMAMRFYLRIFGPTARVKFQRLFSILILTALHESASHSFLQVRVLRFIRSRCTRI